MANLIEILNNENKNSYQLDIKEGEKVTLKTSDTYLDKDIIIRATKSNNSGEIDDTPKYPVATKGEVLNHSIQITPSIKDSFGETISIGAPVSVSASELVNGASTITTNTTTDITNFKEVITDINPIIYVKDVTIATDATRSISFTGLPSSPIAWTLDCTNYVTNIDNQYRCISARRDNEGTYTYTIYKRNGNNLCYVYYQTLGFAETFSNGTLTLTATSAGNAEYCGSFFNKTYRLMAICKNDGRNEIFI